MRELLAAARSRKAQSSDGESTWYQLDQSGLAMDPDGKGEETEMSACA